MNELNTSVFDPILGKDEKVIEMFKPNKFREVWLKIIARLLVSVPFIALFVLIGIFGEESDEAVEAAALVAEEVVEVESSGSPIGFIIFGAAIALFIAISIIITLIGYSKKYFCYTNKRVIIRNGVIGVDYQCLDYELIGGIACNVSLLDKLVKPNTGTISFASAAYAMQQNVKGVSAYAFTSIEDPYNVYKRVKEYFDNYKTEAK